MPGKQAQISRGRPLVLATGDIAAEPTDGLTSGTGATPVTAPHHVMSPRASVGMKTTGIVIGLKIPALSTAAPVAAGFELFLWVANPVTWSWFRTTPVRLQDRDATVTYDINAFPVYIQISAASVAAAGNLEFHFMEM